jgi:hypothetical protein
MSNLPEKPDTAPGLESEQEQKGPNLILLYTLLALALLGAMAVAAMIVWPFYVRR